MRKYIPKSLRGVVILLPCLAFSVWAQPVNLTLENAGAGYVMGGVYTSPYGLSINSSASYVQLICDDFTTDISLGQSWTAIPTTFAALEAGSNPAGTPKFSPATDPSVVPTLAAEIQDYAVTAVLAAELMELPSLASEQAGEISFALWDVFDPTLLNSTSNPNGSITSTELSAAQAYLAGAEALVAGATNGSGIVNLSSISIDGHAIEGMTIYTPNPASASQEFLSVSMAEPSYPLVLGVDLLAVFGLIAVFRRRLTGILS
jgi:hypothetical protein